MNKEPTVWVVQEPWAKKPIDMSSAQRYGKLQYLLGARDVPATTPGPSLNKMQRLLRDFTPGDYFTATLADPCGPMLLGLALNNLNMLHDPINWLRYDRERNGSDRVQGAGFYVPVQIHGRP